ncbi:MAG: signal transduction histidine kinase [Sphingobacteriales bacterium]|jgi:signal transduction histidine kinase
MKFHPVLSLIRNYILGLLSLWVAYGFSAQETGSNSNKTIFQLKLELQNAAYDSIPKINYNIAKTFQSELKYDSVILYCEKSLNHKYTLNNPDFFHQVNSIYFSALRMVGRDEAVLKKINPTISYYRAKKDTQNWIITSIQKSVSYQNQGKLDSASILLLNLLKIVGPTAKGAADIYMDLGRAYDYLGQYTEAIEFYQKGLDLLKLNPDVQSEGLLLYNIAVGYFNMDDYKTMLTFLDRSIAIAMSIPDNNQIATCYLAMSAAYAELGNLDKAEAFLAKCIPIYKEAGMIEDLGLTFYNAAIYSSERKNYSQAITNINQSIEYFEEGKFLTHLPDTYDIKSQILKKQRKFKEAFLAKDIAMSLSDSLKQIQSQETVNNLREKFKADLREKEIENLEAKSAFINAEARSKTIQRNGLIISLILIVIAIWMYVKTQKQRRLLLKSQKSLADKKVDTLLNQQELKVISAMVEGQEQERNRIATDLHDRLGGLLSTVKLQFETLKAKVTKDGEPISDEISKTKKLLDKAVDEVRSISHNLSSGTLNKFGLASALNELAYTVNDTKQIRVEVHIHGLDQRLPENIEVELYRIIQECLSNTLKHSKATEFSINLTKFNKEINLITEDNGIGFNVGKLSAGIGLQNIKRRVEKIKGTINFDSTIGKGTTTVIEFTV